MDKMKKEIILTDIKGTVHRYTDAKAVVDATRILVRITFKYDTDEVIFPVVNILSIRMKEY